MNRLSSASGYNSLLQMSIALENNNDNDNDNTAAIENKRNSP
jgi:hypothetical protein